MAIQAVRRGQISSPSPQTTQATVIRAPTGGMDSQQTLADERPEYCVFSYNLNPSEYGMTVRQGFRRWQSGVESVSANGVRTIIPYNGLAADGSDDRLFAVTNEGIADVTAENGAFISKLVFPDTSGEAGFGVYTAYVTDAEVNLLFYADRVNGLFTYDPGTDTWAQTAGITGVDVTKVNFVVNHKLRLWLGVQGESTGYYLDVASIAGEVKPFYFGGKFSHGGEVVGMYNWSIDGGKGVDDHLVVVSRGGDVLPYRGADPETDSWENIGTYFIGEIPKGNKIGADYGGDLVLLSEFGVTALSDLIKGVNARDPATEAVTFRVSALIRRDLLDLKGLLGWELRYLPTQAILLLCMPTRTDGTIVQYALSRSTEGWCFWRGVPAYCIDTWRGAPVLGTRDNNIERMDSERDNVNIEESFSGEDIRFSLLTNFTSLGSPGRFKRCVNIRPTFIGVNTVTYDLSAEYDYSIAETNFPAVPEELIPTTWDAGIWDLSLWAQNTFEPTFDVRGTLGQGRTVAVAIAGLGRTGTILVSMDMMWNTGGML